MWHVLNDECDARKGVRLQFRALDLLIALILKIECYFKTAAAVEYYTSHLTLLFSFNFKAKIAIY